MSKPTKISYSSVKDFKECPTKMYNKKKYKPIQEGSALAFGSAIESAVEALLRGEPLEKAYSIFKAEWKVKPKNRWERAKPVFDNDEIYYYNSDFDKNLIKSDVTVALFDSWSKEIMGREEKDYVKFVSSVQDKLKKEQAVGQKEKKLFNRIMWYCSRKRGPYIIKAFRDEILPQVEEVIETQKKINMNNSEGDTVLGFVDFVLKLKGIDDPVIIDLKTSGKFYEEHDLDASDQLRIYAAAEGMHNIGYIVVSKALKHDKSCDNCGHVRENNNLTNCAECYDKKAKKGGKYRNLSTYAQTQILTKTLEDEELQDTIEDFSEVLNAIKNGIKWKNPSSCMNYGKKCDFYDHCWKGKKLSELEHIKKK